MEQVIRALSWATRLLWIILIVFFITLSYSVIPLLGNIKIEEPQTFTSDGNAILSIPFFINNTSYCDMSDLNVTTSILYENRFTLHKSTTYEKLIARGKVLHKAHNISINLNQIITNHSSLLFNDTYLNMCALASVKFAKVIPCRIAFNQTIEWGAPLYNFTMHQIFYNKTTKNATVFFSFENHSFMDLNGTIQVQLHDDAGNPIGSDEANVQVPLHSLFEDSIELSVIAKPETGEAHFYFQTTMFRFGPKVIPYG